MSSQFHIQKKTNEDPLGLSQPHCCVGAMGQFVRELETAKPDF